MMNHKIIPVIVYTVFAWVITGNVSAKPVDTDWLITAPKQSTSLITNKPRREITLTNGLISRTWRLSPNAATVGFENLMTGESLLRGVKPEARIEINHLKFAIGGLIGLAKLRLDGFVCLEARDKAGVVVTKSFKLQGSRLLVNVDATKGALLVEILDAQGRVVPGFSAREAKTYKAVDQLRLTPQWRAGRDLPAIKGKVIRLKFHLRNAKLYSFRFLE